MSHPLRLGVNEPELVDLTDEAHRDFYVAPTPFGDVWSGILRRDSGVSTVSITVVRIGVGNDKERKKMNTLLRLHLQTRRELNHENILPLLGVSYKYGPHASPITPWLNHGNLMSYLARSSSLDIYSRLQIICGVAAGLSYLHSRSIVHCGLTGWNVLIDGDGHPRLSGIGRAKLVAHFGGTSQLMQSIRWSAPELYHTSNSINYESALTTHSDIYSFGSIMLQIISGQVPYHYLTTDTQVILESFEKGLYPLRPVQPRMTDNYWTLINDCWMDPPQTRPTIKEVQETLQQFQEVCSSEIVNSSKGPQKGNEEHTSTPGLSEPSPPDGQELPGDGAEVSLVPENVSKLETSRVRKPDTEQDALSESHNGDRMFDSTVEESSNPLLDLTGQVIRENIYPSAFGGFADVWMGTWNKKPGSCKVAIKVLRSVVESPASKAKIVKRLRRELKVWQRLHHENILPLYGIASDFGTYDSMVCPWLENGDLNKYLERLSNTLALPHRFEMLCGVVSGLSYLHSFSIVHGDLTGSNILINTEGSVCLCDFGLSTIVAKLHGGSYFTSSISGAVRWTAPELYQVQEDNSVPPITTFSDIYSFGCIMLQVLSGDIPYHYLRTDAQVLIEIYRGIRPRRPSVARITGEYWEFMEHCWAERPDDRPKVTAVEGIIKNLRNTCH